MDYYCKGYRLRVRRILSTVFLCMGLAGATGAFLHYQEFDRSEELALHKAQTSLLTKRLAELQRSQAIVKKQGVSGLSELRTATLVDEVLGSGTKSRYTFTPSANNNLIDWFPKAVDSDQIVYFPETDPYRSLSSEYLQQSRKE